MSAEPPLALVVVAHPRADSLCHSLARAAVDGLRRAGWAVEVLDLYALGFRAAMSTEEHRAYADDFPPTDEIAARHAELVSTAGHLVFVYPTWWSGLPAIVKGWLERVLVTGVAFGLDPTTHKIVPRLGHIERITGISTYGSSWLYVRLINDNGRRILTRALRLVCGRRVRTSWMALYSIDTSTAHDRERFHDEVSNRLAAMRSRRHG